MRAFLPFLLERASVLIKVLRVDWIESSPNLITIARARTLGRLQRNNVHA